MVGVAACSNEAKGYRVVGRPFEFAAGEDAGGVAVDQERQQGGRVVRLGAASGILPGELGQVELVDHFNNEAGQMVLVEPVVQ